MKGKFAVFIAFVIGIADIYFFGNKLHVFDQPVNHSEDKQVEALAIPAKAAIKGNNGSQIILKIPAMSQQPELYNGCEITSLAMLLNTAGQPINKMDLANQIAKDPTPRVTDDAGNILSWGDPETGFVGDITGKNPGYGVYHKPIFQLLNKILPDKALDLTGSSFTKVLQQVSKGKPVIAWTTVNFSPASSFVTWKGPNGPVQATFNEHVVLIVGFNQTQVLVNDPLDGSAAKAVNHESFEASWNQMGKQAVTIN